VSDREKLACAHAAAFLAAGTTSGCVTRRLGSEAQDRTPNSGDFERAVTPLHASIPDEANRPAPWFWNEME
jgi:hypothetical protein